MIFFLLTSFDNMVNRKKKEENWTEKSRYMGLANKILF